MKSRKDFKIPRIEEEKGTSKDRDFGNFVGSYSGRNVQNKEVYPYVEYGNNARQYQGLDSSFSNKNQVEDKYSPSRIPSYYRREDSQSGISKNNLNFLKGEKMTLDEMRRATSAMYSNNNSNNSNVYNYTKYEDTQEIVEDSNQYNNNYHNNHCNYYL